MALDVGIKAPDFTAEIEGGKKISLKDYKGKWIVLYFYPKDNTSGCTKEACSFRDNMEELTKLGAEVIFVGPPTLMPTQVNRLPVSVSYSLDEVIEKVDVINMLRIQFERLGGNPFPSVREYSHYFGLTVERMKKAKHDILIMHPGPINRGLEIESEVADGNNSVILEQVKNGLAVRMAVLFLVNQAAAQEA